MARWQVFDQSVGSQGSGFTLHAPAACMRLWAIIAKADPTVLFIRLNGDTHISTERSYAHMTRQPESDWCRGREEEAEDKQEVIHGWPIAIIDQPCRIWLGALRSAERIDSGEHLAETFDSLAVWPFMLVPRLIQ